MSIHRLGGEILQEKCAERLSGAGKKVIEKAFIDVGERSPSVAYDIKLPFHPCMFYFDLPEHIALKLIPYSTSGYNGYTHFFLYRKKEPGPQGDCSASDGNARAGIRHKKGV